MPTIRFVNPIMNPLRRAAVVLVCSVKSCYRASPEVLLFVNFREQSVFIHRTVDLMPFSGLCIHIVRTSNDALQLYNVGYFA